MTTNLDGAWDRPVETIDDLVQLFQGAQRPPGQWLVGVEHEKIGVLDDSGLPVPYAGDRGLLALFERLVAQGDWGRIHDGGRDAAAVIALQHLGEGRSETRQITLEPGGQMELSAAPQPDGVAAAAELRAHHDELLSGSRALGLRWLGVGMRPFGSLDDCPTVPKGRYAVMMSYLPLQGARALDMMKRTATVQVNLDFSDEADCAYKLRTALGVSPILTALYACSPWLDGRATGFSSMRAACWLDTDPQRCGLLEFALGTDEPTSVYRAYAEWASDVPMFFVFRQGTFRPMPAGFTFRRLLREGYGGERASLADFELHLSTVFPEVRLKRTLELRGADSGPLSMVEALAPLARGLLYDRTACAAAWSLVAALSWAERQQLRLDVPRQALEARAQRHSLRELAIELVAIARDGLRRLGATPAELALLDPLADVAVTGRPWSARLLDQFGSNLGEDPASLSKVVDALAYF
jgi:glutamate--cysteine ligase